MANDCQGRWGNSWRRPPIEEFYYYRARYYDPQIGSFLNEDILRFEAGTNFRAYVGNDPVDFVDPSGMLKLCCRLVRIPIARRRGACHCFLELSDGTTLGGYFKPFRGFALVPQLNNPDDRHPKDTPTCESLPGGCDQKARAAFDTVLVGTYGLDGTSNAVVEETLTRAGIPHRLPPCAWGNTPPSLPMPAMPNIPSVDELADRLTHSFTSPERRRLDGQY